MDAANLETDAHSVNQRHRITVVVATHERLSLLKRVLESLSGQTLPPDRFEVVVVDDGSPTPVGPELESHAYPFRLVIVRQDNRGPAVARHEGVLRATGDLIVFVDDDMFLPPRFLEAHLACHRGAHPTAVIGRYISAPNIAEKALFERYHGLKWDQTTALVREGRLAVDGTYLASGNASMRREDYLRVGGFDSTLLRAEDMDLGLALENAGVLLQYSDDAGSVHLSDHTQPEKWMARAYLHGRLERRIAEKYPTFAHADPWRYAFSLPLVGRALCMPGILFPKWGAKLAVLAYRAAELADAAGWDRSALRATGLVFGMEYFRGLREEVGNVPGMMRGCFGFLKKVSNSAKPMPGVPSWLVRFATYSAKDARAA